MSIVRLGESDLSYYSTKDEFVNDYEVEKFIRHDDYDSTTFYNDIALIKLKSNVNFSKNVRPACLHQKNYEDLTFMNAVAIGFGNTGYDEDPSEILLKVNLTMLNPSKCKEVNEDRELRSQLCVKGNLTESGSFGDACQGRRSF